VSYVIHLTEEQLAEYRAYREEIRNGRIKPALIPTELPPDLRTEEEKQADHDRFLEHMILTLLRLVSKRS